MWKDPSAFTPQLCIHTHANCAVITATIISCNPCGSIDISVSHFTVNTNSVKVFFLWFLIATRYYSVHWKTWVYVYLTNICATDILGLYRHKCCVNYKTLFTGYFNCKIKKHNMKYSLYNMGYILQE